jgi:hypothetical protein
VALVAGLRLIFMTGPPQLPSRPRNRGNETKNLVLAVKIENVIRKLTVVEMSLEAGECCVNIGSAPNLRLFGIGRKGLVAPVACRPCPISDGSLRIWPFDFKQLAHVLAHSNPDAFGLLVDADDAGLVPYKNGAHGHNYRPPAAGRQMAADRHYMP